MACKSDCLRRMRVHQTTMNEPRRNHGAFEPLPVRTSWAPGGRFINYFGTSGGGCKHHSRSWQRRCVQRSSTMLWIHRSSCNCPIECYSRSATLSSITYLQDFNTSCCLQSTLIFERFYHQCISREWRGNSANISRVIKNYQASFHFCCDEGQGTYYAGIGQFLQRENRGCVTNSPIFHNIDFSYISGWLCNSISKHSLWSLKLRLDCTLREYVYIWRRN